MREMGSINWGSGRRKEKEGGGVYEREAQGILAVNVLYLDWSRVYKW